MTYQQFPELVNLLGKVSAKYGGRIITANDFSLLSEHLRDELGVVISASTLKRLWGYDAYESTPRVSTLDLLANYIGEDSFQSFCENIRKDPSYVSGFMTSRMLSSSDLEEGETVSIGWNPNRLVKLRYLGEDLYEVVSNSNSKLREGDRFHLISAIVGYPLYLSDIVRDGVQMPLYVAAFDDGLTLVMRD